MGWFGNRKSRRGLAAPAQFSMCWLVASNWGIVGFRLNSASTAVRYACTNSNLSPALRTKDIMTVLLLIGAIVWGSLSAQFLVQAIVSSIATAIALSGLLFSRVSKTLNFGAALASFGRTLLFGLLFIGGNWCASHYIDLRSWDAITIASVLSFIGTVVYCVPQIPGKVLLAKMCAWQPYFLERSNVLPKGERVTFARKVQANKAREMVTSVRPRSTPTPPRASRAPDRSRRSGGDR